MAVTGWTYKLDLTDVFHDPHRSFEQKRDEIVRRIKASQFYREDEDELFYIVDEIADSVDGDEFDQPWDLFYDYANAKRVWVATR